MPEKISNLGSSPRGWANMRVSSVATSGRLVPGYVVLFSEQLSQEVWSP